MSNIIKFPTFDKMETKEVYTWLQLLFADSTPDKIVHISCYSFGGDGEWQFLPVATIEDLDSCKAYVYFYDTGKDMFFVDAWWDIDDDGEWCVQKDIHIATAIKVVNPNNHAVECQQIFGE